MKRWDDFQPAGLPVCSDQTASEDVIDLHRFRHVHVCAEIRRQHTLEAFERCDVSVRLVPDSLELVVIDEEMDSAMLDCLFAGRVIEAHQRVRGGDVLFCKHWHVVSANRPHLLQQRKIVLPHRPHP